jgi:hypothetical protein
MGNRQTAIVNNIQNVSNDIIENSYEICNASCTVDISGVHLIIGNSTIQGGINIGGQACSANAYCTMNNELDVQLQNIIDSITNQALSAESPLLIPHYNNQTDIISNNQTLRNTITQMMNSSCQSNTTNLIQNDYVYVNESSVDGGVNVGFTQSGSSTANCSMNNISKVNVYNNETAKSDQVEKWENTFATIAIIIVISIILLGVFVLLTMGHSAKATNSSETLLQQELLLQSLGGGLGSEGSLPEGVGLGRGIGGLGSEGSLPEGVGLGRGIGGLGSEGLGRGLGGGLGGEGLGGEGLGGEGLGGGIGSEGLG